MHGANVVYSVEIFAFAICVFVAQPVMSDPTTILNFSDALCGKQESSRRTKIVGGVQAKPGEFPWIVSIRQGGSHTCGGVVVNSKWIVTAAHCFCNGPTIESMDKFDVTINRSGFRNFSSQHISILREIIHPNYTCSGLHNDIALLELVVKISWLNADPACFPLEGESLNADQSNNVKAIAVGWGATNEDLSLGSVPWNLHKVQVPILENYECQQWYESQNKTLRLQKSQMCAGYKNGQKDTCWADSGGPLMVKKGVHMVVVGLVSTGIGCARASLPGIYTRLSEYVKWIGYVLFQTANA